MRMQFRPPRPRGDARHRRGAHRVAPASVADGVAVVAGSGNGRSTGLSGYSRIELPLPFEHVPLRRGVLASPGRTNRSHLVTAVIAILALAGAFVAPQLGTWLSVADEPAPAPVTFLSYGVSIRRGALDAAVGRVRTGETARVVLGALNSRDAEYYVTPHSSDLAREYLVARGVPADQIEVMPSVSSEWDEGHQLRAVASRLGTSGIEAYAPDFRARRTRGVLRRILEGTGVAVRVVAVPDVEVRLARWWETRPGLNVIYNEYPRLGYYWLLGRLG